MENDFLKYGDQICLYTDQVNGYLATMGFNSQQLFIQQCSNLHLSHIPNIRNLVFQVVPKLGYDPMRELRRERKAAKTRENKMEGGEGKSGNDLFQGEKIKMLQKRIEQQTSNNDKWISQMYGKRVMYGTPIQLRHVDSGMYLQHAKRSSELDRSCQLVELVKEPSAQRVTFYIAQRYKYRLDGEAVVFNDHVLLYNQKYNCYLHCSEEFLTDQTNLKSKPSAYRPLSPLRRQNPNSLFKSLECNCSPNFYKWQVVNYRQQTQKDSLRYLFSGEVIRLKHAETAGYFGHDEQSKKKPGNPAYVRIFKGQDESDRCTTNNLFEIEAHDDNKTDTIQNQGMALEWRARGLSSFAQVRLRHLNSGKLVQLRTIEKKNSMGASSKSKRDKKHHILTLGDHLDGDQINHRLDTFQKIEQENQLNNDFNVNTDPQILELTKGVDQSMVFEIENTLTDSNPRVKNLSVVKISNRSYNPHTNQTETLTISTEIRRLEGDEQPEEEEEMESGQPEDADASIVQGNQSFSAPEEGRDEEEHQVDSNKFTPMMYDESDNIIINSTKLVKGGSMDDVYILEKVKQQEVQDVLFIHSCVPMIKEFTYNLRFDKQTLTSPYMKKFEDLLMGLVFFIVETDSKDPFTCEGQPKKEIQKYLREIKIIDLLIDILIYPFDSEDSMYNLDDLTQRSPMTRVCQLIYRLLKHCVKDNEFNKFYVAQWISHFFHQSMMTTDKNNLMAEGTITEILDNNKQLLDKQINDIVIKNIVENCASSRKNMRFLNLLSALCSCNGEAIGSNQDDICDFLLEDEEFANLLIKIDTRIGVGGTRQHFAIFNEEEVMVNGKPLELEVENMKTYFKDDLRLYNYFESMCNLVSLMSLSRNYKGIQPLQEMYSLDFTIDSFLNQKVPEKLRANLAKILISVHIDKDPLEQINLPILTRVWQEIAQAKTTLPQSKDQINLKLLKLKDYVIEFFNSMAGIQRAYETDLNILTFQILNILEKMILLGFYTSEAELILIINPIISLLDGSNDFTSREEEEAYNKFEERKREEVSSNTKAPKGVVFGNEKFKRDKSLRYKNNEYNVIIFSIKKKIIQILHYVVNIQNDIRLTRFLIEFYKADNQLMLNTIASGPEIFFLQHTLQGQVNDDDDEIKKRCDDKVISWMKFSYANKNLDMRSKSEKDLICILLDIILYQDVAMVNSAFTLLARYFNQQRAIIDFANEVQLLQDDQEVATLNKVSAQLREMKKEAENSEFWMGLEGKDNLKKARQFINQLELLTDLCIDNPDRIIDLEEGKKTDENHEEEEEQEDELEFLNLSELLQEWDNEDPKICDDDEVNDEKNQRLLRNLRAFEVPVIIIRQQALEAAQNQNAYLRVLEKAYVFLLKFVRNNKENQLMLLEYLDLFIEDMEYGVHAWELICEIFRNSSALLTYQLVPIIKKSIKFIDGLPKETLKKTILLSFLTYYMFVNENSVRENQITICTEITSSIRKNSDHLFVGEQGLKDLHLYMLEMKSSYAEFMGDERFLQEIQIPPELCYVIEYIRLLGTCGDGKNSATEAIASEKLPLTDVIANLKMADFCYPYKSALVNFLDSIYFDIEKDVSDENISLMWEAIKIINLDIEKFLEIQQRVKSQKGNAAVKRTVIEKQDDDNPDGVYVDINKNFNMLTAFGSFPIVQLMEKYIFEIVFPAIQHYLELRLPIKPNQKDFVKKFFSLIQQSVSFSSKDIHFESSKELFNSIKKIPQLKEFGGENMSNKQLSQWMQRNDSSNNQRTDEDMMVGIPNLSQAQKLKAYLSSVSSSENLLKEIEKEFEEIVVYILQIEQKTEEAFGGTNTLEVKELIQSLIKVSDIDSDIDSNLRIICLKVIRKVIEMENKQADNKPSSEWDSDDWNMFEDEIVEKQNMLINLGVVKLLCNLIAYEQKKLIKEEALLVSIACLLGGNHDTQEYFGAYIKEDASNQFIISLRDMLIEAFESMDKTQAKRNEDQAKLIQIEKRLEDLEAIENPTKQQRQERGKQIELRRVIEEEIKASQLDENENPASYTTNELTVARSINNAKVILRFMQLLCENHNINLQNALRVQVNEDEKSKNNSFDFCSYLSRRLEQFQKLLNAQTFDVCAQLVDTLIESIQGPCKQNQKALVNSKIIDSSREYISGYEKESDLIPLELESEDDLDSISDLKKNIITMLTSLLEGEIDMDIINRMANSLDFDTMKNRMLSVFQRFAEKTLNQEGIQVKDIPIVKLNSKLQKDSFDDSVAEAFEIYILVHSLADNIKTAEDHLQRQKFNADQWKAFEFIRAHTGRIEVNVDNNLQRVYFPIRPVCHYISLGARKKLMIEVDRESQQTKVTDLLEAVPDLIDEMNHNEELSRAAIQITPGRLTALKDFSTLIGIVINLIYLIFSKRKYHYREEDIDTWVIDTIEYLGYVQGCSSFILIFFFAINKMNLITRKKWREYIDENKNKGFELLPNNDRLEVDEMSFEMTHLILMLKGPQAPEFNLEDKVNFGNWFTWSEEKILNMYFFIQDSTFQYYVLYFGISILAFKSESIYYSFHLLDVINRSPVLQNVMKAVTQNLSQVGLTGLLMMILVYIYTTLTFFIMQDGMYDYEINAYDSDIVGENNCNSMFQCFVTTLDKGMRNGGGIGDITEPIHFNDETEKYLFKLVHDASFQIIINIICLNIIFGIIVNTFAQLRDEKSKNDNDMNNKCYICNHERMIFDKNSEGGFDRHIEKDHNLWQYCYYIVHLSAKDSSDYNGLESVVKEKLDEEDITWVPRQKALCLQNMQKSEEENGANEELNAILKEWQLRIHKCVLTLQEIQMNIQKKEKQRDQEKKEREAQYKNQLSQIQQQPPA